MTLDDWVRNYCERWPAFDEDIVRTIGGAAWVTAFGEGYEAALDDAELADDEKEKTRERLEKEPPQPGEQQLRGADDRE
jgi:hypothetical protein